MAPVSPLLPSPLGTHRGLAALQQGYLLGLLTLLANDGDNPLGESHHLCLWCVALVEG